MSMDLQAGKRLGGGGGRLPELVTRKSGIVTLSAAATKDVTGLILAGDVGAKVFIRAVDDIGGCTSMSLGITTDTDRFGTLIGIDAGDESSPANWPDGEVREEVYAADATVRITAVGGAASFTAGRRVYLECHAARYDKELGNPPGIS